VSENSAGNPNTGGVGDFEPTLGAAAPDVEAVLPWREVLLSLASMFRLSGRVIFRRKLLFMVVGIAAYYAILYTFAVYQPNSGFGVDDALLVLVELPGTVLGVYLAMDLIAKERDRHTLEVLFSTASSHYTVWTIRMLSVYFVLLLTLLTMSAASYFLFAEFPFFWGGLNAFLPAFLLANLTFYASVFTRSANAAGMLALGFIILVLMTYEGLQGTNWDLFLKPFEIPVSGEDPLWAEKMLINRLSVFIAGSMLLFLALRRMEQRERLLT
jgi:hypothetical protein